MSKFEDIKAVGILLILKTAYKYLIRGILYKAINDDDSEWDDALMSFVDKMFDYEE